MPNYQVPLRDLKFAFYEVHKGAELSQLPGYEEATPDLIDAVLEASARMSEDVFFPLNQIGDQQGCRYENGVVRTPDGFKEAYEQWRDGGWQGLSVPTSHGGQGMPYSVMHMLEEINSSANLGLSLYFGLTSGAVKAIMANASEDLQALYLPKMVTGEWSGTMCLTEPQCGTDLGLIQTKAEPLEDGSYALTGQKIFISSGEHDLTDNIVHLVLAKLPDAPSGNAGISLFLVPKFLPSAQNGPGERNGVRCASLESKMGMHGNSTAVLDFNDAKGWLVGEPHQGLRGMFVMMNAARIGVAMQGLGVAEIAYQSALAYAKERLQMRAPGGAVQPEKVADPILVHPDVQRMLLRIKANTEGCRALGLWLATAMDQSSHHPDAAIRQSQDDLVQLLTPIAKAYFTDMGFESANLALQVFGGHGYIRDWGMEQLVRDARITQIYEGTNGIQAMDLVGRKLGFSYGRYLKAFFHPVQQFIEAEMHNERLAAYVLPLAKVFAKLQQASGLIAERGMKDPAEGGAAASDYLRLFALVALAYIWARMAKLALEKVEAGEEDAAFYQAKIKTANFFFARLLPEADGLFKMILAGNASLAAFELQDWAA
jgi:alkylation response protein AidB-like acyl-CoA dehydrogenase